MNWVSVHSRKDLSSVFCEVEPVGMAGLSWIEATQIMKRIMFEMKYSDIAEILQRVKEVKEGVINAHK